MAFGVTTLFCRSRFAIPVKRVKDHFMDPCNVEGGPLQVLVPRDQRWNIRMLLLYQYLSQQRRFGPSACRT